MLDFKNIDIEFLLDKSASMLATDTKGNKSRWKYAQESVLGLATSAQKHDPDGITVVPFAGGFKVYEGVTADKVNQVFVENEPGGSTDTDKALKARLDAYFDRKAKGGTKSVCLFVMTDGEPNDQNAVANVIIEATKKIKDRSEIAVQFIQVGNDGGAKTFLKFLDDNLTAKGAAHDIVDTIHVDEIENFNVESLLEKSFSD